VDADDGVVRIEARTKRDERVAIWSARRNADLLERALGKKVEIERA
jgi:hypothetical protein